jgi:zinc transporter ZupT
VAAASVLVRLHRADGVERQQIKWFAYSASVLAIGALISWVISDAVDAWWLRWEIGFVVTVAGLAGLPVALGIAILRYRLHDIDLIVNRALVYGILTAILAGVFEITLVTVQHVLLVFTHVEDSSLAYFATAMVMASLFEPLKRRIDAIVEGFFLQDDESPETAEPVLSDGARAE